MKHLKEWKRIFSFFLSYLSRVRTQFIGVLLLIFGGTAISNIVPLIWGQIIDCLTKMDQRKLLLLMATYIGVTVLTSFLGLIENYIGVRLDYKLNSMVSEDIFDKTLRLTCSDLDKFDAGELVSRLTSDIDSVVSFTLDFFTSITTIVINVITAAYFSIKLSPVLALVSLFSVPISFFFNNRIKKLYRLVSELEKKYTDRKFGFLVETLNHIQDSKPYLLEKEQNKQYHSLITDGWGIQKKQLLVSYQSSVSSVLISSVSNFITIYVTGVLILKENFTVGNFVSFQAYISKLISGISRLLQMDYSAQAVALSVDRLENLLSRPSEAIYERGSDLTIEKISFANVSFSYESKKDILSNLTFSICSPGVYTFIGENGCGKTTILKMIMRYYPPSSGNILINDKNITDYPLSSIRHNIRYFAKNVYIKKGSLLSNLLLGTPYYHSDIKIPPPRLIELCEVVGLINFIEGLPERYLTDVGENGKLLSSGQKQKIALVRAMLCDCSMFLFDEETSDLDFLTEKETVKLLNRLGKEHIVIRVSHRLISIASSDLIFIIKDGQIVNAGTHAQLLEDSPEYRAFIPKQKAEIEHRGY